MIWKYPSIWYKLRFFNTWLTWRCWECDKRFWLINNNDCSNHYRAEH